MRTFHGVISLLSCLVLTGCEAGSPAAPPAPTPVLAVSQATAALERAATAQVTASSTVAGATIDVTTIAAWRSSNDQVATVVGGLITAIGPGTATITAEHSGQTAMTSVTVRRRVFLEGRVTVTSLDDDESIEALTTLVDGIYAGNAGTSSPDPWLYVPIGTKAGQVSVGPGEHTLTLQMRNAPDNYEIEFAGPLKIRDFDTGEAVASVVLDNRQGAFGTNAKITWSVSVSAYTS